MAKKSKQFGDILKTDEIPNKGMSLSFTASEEHRTQLARRFDIPVLSQLQADFFVKPLAGGPMIRVDLTLTAVLEQACVISGEPVPGKIDSRIELEFAPESMIDENIELTLDDADPPDPIENGAIDLGEVVAQQLSLALDPYPRAPDAEFTDILDDLPKSKQQHLDRSDKKNPFAVLAQLSQNRASDGEEE